MSGLSAIVPIETETLGVRVYLQLREMLIAGQFAPGEKLTLRTLAAAIGTSPMPVRDALRQLMVDQAIELLPNRVFRVPLMSKSRFIELREIRIRMEGMAIEYATERISAPELAEAAALSAAFNAECDLHQPDPAKLIVLNKNLHFTLYRASRLPALLQIVEGLWTQIGPVLNLDVRSGSERITSKTPTKHHEAMIAALKIRDADAAKAALADDLRSASDYILRQNRLT
ncbi:MULTISPECIES: GntR family transcriptional regulator [unclassified Mesorhizobium]|uniref:GntR family transcriptional regulator n=1 Tax=unclassified Mesorhizobium TaxID=325217 RepID=UPI0033350DF3